MKTEEPEYITLGGYPLHVPLWKTFHQTAGVQAGIVVAGLAVATDVLLNKAANMFELLPLVAVAPAVNGMHKFMEAALIDSKFKTNMSRLFFTEKKLAIDTRPPEYLKTSANLLSSAMTMRRDSLIVLAAYSCGFSAIATAIAMKPTTEENTSFLISAGMGTILASASGTFAACAHRFNKVVKGDYVIVDAPPKKPKEELEISDPHPDFQIV